MKTLITVKRSVNFTGRKVTLRNTTFPTRAKARVIASLCKDKGLKVLNPVKCAEGWRIPHKGGVLSLNN